VKILVDTGEKEGIKKEKEKKKQRIGKKMKRGGSPY